MRNRVVRSAVPLRLLDNGCSQVRTWASNVKMKRGTVVERRSGRTAAVLSVLANHNDACNP